jgi:predicted nucleic acid-binding protein
MLLKNGAQKILNRIEGGEDGITTLVHISEVANILEARTALSTAADIVIALLMEKNLKVVEPTRKDYLKSIRDAQALLIGINDALAYNVMQKENIHEIYSFDSHFDRIDDIKRVIA